MEDKVKCKICGAMFKWVTSTHLRLHNLTIPEYKKMFPDAELVSEKTRETISAGIEKRFKDPEERKKRSDFMKKKYEDPEERKKTGDAIRKSKEDPNIRKKISDAAIKRWSDPEERKRMSDAGIKRYKDPEYRKKTSDAGIKRFEDPEERKKTSAANIKRYEDPEERKKLSDFMKKKYEDPEERKKISGENSSNWRGGISFGKYCPKFNNRVKKHVRDKYNNNDFISGLPDHLCNSSRKLDVHHIDYNKQQGCDDHKWRLIPLSRSNHAKTEYNRPFWNTLFTYALDYDENYCNESPIDMFAEMRCNV